MAEKMKSISEARQNLPTLSQTAQKQMDRFIITHQGQPQSVLIGYDEYRGMKAAGDLLHRPDVVESIKTGLKDLAEGRRLSGEEMKKRISDRSRSSDTSDLSTELAGKYNIDKTTIAS